MVVALPGEESWHLVHFLGILTPLHFWGRNSFELGGWQLVYAIALGLVEVGTGCALLAYHAQEGGEEDTATKKKIILVGMAVMMPIAALAILGSLRIL